MEQGLSLEALELRAKDLLSQAHQEQSERLRGQPPQPSHSPDASVYASSHKKASQALPALGVLFAETVTTAALCGPEASYELAWKKSPLGFVGETTIAPRALWGAIAAESNTGRRANLAHLAATRVIDRQRDARPVVEALRSSAERLKIPGDSLPDALGWGSAKRIRASAELVLAETTDAFVELDRWVRPRLELPRLGPLAWHERLRTTAASTASERISTTDRAGLSTRWLERLEFVEVLRSLRDNTSAAQNANAGVFALAHGGDRVELTGTPAPGASGLWNYSEAVGEAFAYALGARSELTPALRLGHDRMHAGLSAVLTRRLWLDPLFVQRDAEVDRARSEPVLLEALFAELYRLRWDAALSLYLLDVLTRAQELPTRFCEHLRRALMDAPEPAWAVHYAARVWELHPSVRLLGALREPALREELREHHDEDWFRNPRAGAELRAHLTQVRRTGWPESEEKIELEALEQQRQALARRIEEALNVARA